MPQLSNYGITAEDRDLLLRALDDGAVNLLTGAGASYGSIGGDGEELKGAAELARELNAKFSLTNSEPDCSNLQLVYGDITSIAGNQRKLIDFLIGRFTNCQVKWQALLFQLPWKRIWTLNIDDLLRRAEPSSFGRTVNTYSWNDKLRVRTRDGDDLQIIHLHGRVIKKYFELKGIIFSLQDYASRHEISPGWHAEFRTEFVKKPFIICGSRLRDEFDLATVLAFGNRSRDRGGCPSFVVLRDFAPGEEDRFKRQGLVPVRSTGHEFFSSLLLEYESWRTAIDMRRKTSRESEIEITSKFRKLEITSSKPKKALDYYSAAEAQWHHIVADLDARLSELPVHLAWLSEKPVDQRVSLVLGGPVSGKTTFAFRLAHELAATGYDILDFRGEEYFEEKLVLDYLTAAGPTVLVFDDCADVSGALSSLLSEAIERRISLRVIATAQKNRRRGVQKDLSLSQLRIVELEPLRRENFVAVFTKRNEKGRIGQYAGLDVADVWKDFKDHYNYKFLEWLESVEGALPYQVAMERILDDGAGQSARARQLVFAAAAAHRFGFSLPFEFADAIRGTVGLEELIQQEGELSDIAYLDERGLRLRSRSFSIRLWQMASDQEKYEITLFLAKHLAPLVVPQSIARRSYAYRILRELMDCDVVRVDLRDRANDWYEALLPDMGWNSRYWEQRALLASKEKQDDRAYSYAKTAVDKQSRDAFAHTTLGTVCLNIATRRFDPTGLERFWEGVRSLKRSRDLAAERRTEWEHPFITFFTYALRAYPLYPQSAERISSEWANWMRDAKQSFLFNFDNEGPEQLRTYQTEWLKLAVTR
jgi:SIR2-like domain